MQLSIFSDGSCNPCQPPAGQTLALRPHIHLCVSNSTPPNIARKLETVIRRYAAFGHHSGLSRTGIALLRIVNVRRYKQLTYKQRDRVDCLRASFDGEARNRC
jgi:hypothetical protein